MHYIGICCFFSLYGLYGPWPQSLAEQECGSGDFEFVMFRVGYRPLRHLRPHSHGSGPNSHGGPASRDIMRSGGAASRVTWAGLICNVGMAVGKGIGGYMFHSQALVADAVHAVSDMGSDFMTLATIKFVQRPASRFFPDGYGKVESMGALGVNALLVFAGVSMGWTGIVSLAEIIFGHTTALEWMSMIGHHHSGGGDIADWNAAWIALASIIIKEGLFRVTYKVGERENSPVLIANAWHHRADCYASIVALLAISGGQIFNAPWMDSAGAIIVSFAIFHAGWGPFKESFAQLIGNNRALMESETYPRVETAATTILKSIDSSLVVKDIQLKPFGPSYTVSIRLDGPDNLSLDEIKHASMVLSEDLKAIDPNMKKVYVNL